MKNLKSEKGAITLVVLVIMLFLVSFLMSSYMIVSNRAQKQQEISKEIQQLYKDDQDLNELYNGYINNDIIPIYTVEQLLKIGSGDQLLINEKYSEMTWNATYALMNDLEFNVSSEEVSEILGGNEWIPINSNESFKGYFEGNGHTIKVTNKAGEIEVYSSLNNYTVMQEDDEISYYSSFAKAFKLEEADSDKENAVASVYTNDDGETVLTLLKDTTENEGFIINRDIIIDLGGNKLTFNNNEATSYAFDSVEEMEYTVEIDGRTNGSEINVISTGTDIYVFRTKGNNFIINGGTYTANCTAETLAGQTYVSAIRCSKAGKLIMNDCSIKSSTLLKGTTDKTVRVYGVESGGKTNLTNCDIKAYSNYYSENDMYTVCSIGINVYKTSSVVLKDCNVTGTQAGIENKGNLYIDGGIYESFAHGGIYFTSNGTGDNEAYVSNATLRICTLMEGYTTHDPDPRHPAFYIGGGATQNNISVYMDNCDIEGYQYQFVLRGSSGEQNNTLYISNSRIVGNAKIRIDNNTHKIYLGKGNNFDISNIVVPASFEQFDVSTVVFNTDEVYVKK